LRAEGLSCSFDVLFRVLGISKLQFLIKKYQIFFFRCKFFSIFGHQSLDPDQYSVKNAESGSETLQNTISKLLLQVWGLTTVPRILMHIEISGPGQRSLTS
jgi:hypothetical protein